MDVTKKSYDPERAPRSHHKTQAVVFTIIIFLLVLVALEVVLRTTHLFGARIAYTEPDYRLGWRFTPGSKYWFYKENDHPIAGRINRYGYRDNEWSIEKPANTYRIAVLGDSYVAAFQVEPDSTFLTLTEQGLNATAGCRVEFMNFGRPGYTQTEQLLILQDEITQFSPDMVILFFVPGNDIEDVRKQTSPVLLRPFYSLSEDGRLTLDTGFAESRAFKLRVRINWLKQHSALLSLLAERFNLYQRQRRTRGGDTASDQEEPASPGRIPAVLTLCTDRPDSSYLKSYHLNRVLIKAIADYCRVKGFAFMLVTIDTPAYRPETEETYAGIDPTFDPNHFEDDLRAYAGALGIEYLGLQRVFRQAYLDQGAPLHWGHWNYRGHRLVSEALTHRLEPVVCGRPVP